MDDYVFRLLDVDLSNGETEIATIGSETIQRFIGATGLAAWFLAGPLTGTPVTSSGRHGVAGRSPLTGFRG